MKLIFFDEKISSEEIRFSSQPHYFKKSGGLMRAYKTIIPFLKEQGRHYIIGILVLILVDFANLLVPQVFKNFADLAVGGNLNLENLAGLLLRLLILGFSMAFGRYIWRIKIFGTARDLNYWLRDKLFQKYLSLDSEFYSKNRTGDLMAHATNDINAITLSMGVGIMMFIDAFFLTIFTVIMMILTAGLKTASIALLSLPFMGISISILMKPLRKRGRIVQNTFSELTSEVQENLAGIRVIKAFAIEDNRMDSFNKVNEKYTDKVMALNRLDGLFDPIVILISGFSLFIFMIYGSRQIAEGTMSLGSFVAIIEYLYIIIWPLIATGLVSGQFQKGISSMKRINEILAARPKVTEKEGAVEKVGPGKIEFRNVSFRYKSDLPWVLENISFTMEAGTSLAILGRTGSGKSTIVKLLLRLYDVSEGSILIDGVDIRMMDFESIYKTLSYVSQENFLFSRTVAENISFSAEDVDMDKVEDAAIFSQVDGDIKAMAQGYESMVGERGVTLSGGQKQRVSIARAYYKNAPVLILDDALSAVDTETESRILDQLKQHDKGLVLVSQRVSTVEAMNQILVIEDGKISQRGRHQDLVKQDGFYKDLYKKQLLEAEADNYEEENYGE